MMTIKKSLLCLIILMTSISISWAQFSLSGEIKPKAEYRDGYKLLPSDDDSPAGFISQRTRLFLDYKQSKIKTHFSFQDARIWGQEVQKEHVPSLAIHEAWAELFLNDSLSLKVGRQTLIYDNQRFFSENNWSLYGQKHDVVLIKHTHNIFDLHFGNAFNQSGYNTFETDYGLNNYKFLSFLWLKVNLGDKNYFSVTGIADGYEKPTNHDILYVRGTYTGFLSYYFNDLNIVINPAFQNGKTKTGKDISAYYTLAEINMPITSKYKIHIGTEYFSGNNNADTDDKVFRAFDPLYGGVHRFNGLMDYFTYPGTTKYAGLINPYLKNSFAISEQIKVSLDVHMFMLANNYVFDNAMIDKYLGTETDFSVNYKINDIAYIAAGYSFMVGTESMEIIKGGNKDNHAHWAYVMINAKPKFIK